MAWRDLDIGAVSAYAIAVEHGYTGTEEEWANEQAAAGENARIAKESAKTAVAAAKAAQSNLDSIKPNTEQAIANIQTEGSTQRSSVTSTGDAQNQRVMDTGAEQSRALSAQGDTEQRKVIAAGDEQVSRVTTAGNNAVESVTLEKTNAINDVQNTKIEAVNSVETAKTSAVEAVKSAESAAIQNIGTGVDDTLSISGKAADAKKTGDSISSLKNDMVHQFFNMGRNLFDCERVQIGLYHSDGTYNSGNTNYVTTTYMVYCETLRGKYITTINNAIIAWFNRNDEFIGTTENTKYSNRRQVPESAAYAKFCAVKSTYESEFVCITDSYLKDAPAFEAFYFKMRYADYVSQKDFNILKNDANTLPMLNDAIHETYNDFDMDNVESGLLDTNKTSENYGKVVPNVNYVTTDYINVSDKYGKYYASTFGGVAFLYDADKNILNPIGSTGVLNHRKLDQSGTEFMRFSVPCNPATPLSETMIYFSEYNISEMPNYKPFGTELDKKVYSERFLEKTYNTQNAGKSLVVDSDGNTKPMFNRDYMQIFHKICVIGDSLSSGEIVKDGIGVDCYEWSWLSNICKKIGATAIHSSRGGIAVKDWFYFYNTGEYKDSDFDDCDAVFIAMGTNDAGSRKDQYSGGIGSASDETTDDTFCGYYKKLVEMVHEKNPDCKIFCMSLYSQNSSFIPYSDAIEEICKLYSYCYFVDFASNSDVLLASESEYCTGGHFNSYGYVLAAEIIHALTNKVIMENKNDFRFVGINRYTN